jgi:predicted metal-binding membrane protein
MQLRHSPRFPSDGDGGSRCAVTPSAWTAATAAALTATLGVAVWALVGVAVYALYRPHGSLAAGAGVIAAGAYELTPRKQRFRARCRESVGSGFEYGLCCVGSSIGLMLILLALSVMSVAWMIAITVIGLAQKLLPANAAIDAPVALAIVALGVLIVVAPSSVPGFTAPM